MVIWREQDHVQGSSTPPSPVEAHGRCSSGFPCTVQVYCSVVSYCFTTFLEGTETVVGEQRPGVLGRE